VKPKWLALGEEITELAIRECLAVTNNFNPSDLQVQPIPFMSVLHFNACLSLSINANVKGWHSAAICLLRQCVEALSIIEIGLQDTKYAEPMLLDWSEGKKSHGELRKSLSVDVWPSYGSGLWDEKWSEYFTNLAKAVQPYAHYSHETQGWQWVNLQLLSESSFIVGMGPSTYDPLKASRLTLMHILVGWTLTKILLESGKSENINKYRDLIESLRDEVAKSKLLFKGKDWATQFLPIVFFKNGYSFVDE